MEVAFQNIIFIQKFKCDNWFIIEFVSTQWIGVSFLGKLGVSGALDVETLGRE